MCQFVPTCVCACVCMCVCHGHAALMATPRAHCQSRPAAHAPALQAHSHAWSFLSRVPSHTGLGLRLRFQDGGGSKPYPVWGLFHAGPRTAYRLAPVQFASRTQAESKVAATARAAAQASACQVAGPGCSNSQGSSIWGHMYAPQCTCISADSQ